MIRIRKARASDIKPCYALMRKTRELYGADGLSPEWWLGGLIKRGIAVVAEDSGEIIGFNAGEDLLSGGVISHLIVIKKDYRGKGLASQMNDAFEKQCKSKKKRWVLTYAKDDGILDRLYRKAGYKKGHALREYAKNI